MIEPRPVAKPKFGGARLRELPLMFAAPPANFHIVCKGLFTAEPPAQGMPSFKAIE